MTYTQRFFSTLGLGLVLWGGVTFPANPFFPSAVSVTHAAQKTPEALTLDKDILVPIGEKSALAKAHALQKERMGLESWTQLAPSLAQSLTYTRSWPQEERAIEHNEKRVTWGEVTASLELLQSLLPQLDANPGLLAQHFTWLHVSPKTHFTGYFSPIMSASRTQKEGYTYPLYRVPEEIAPHLAYCLPTHSCPEEAFTNVIKPDPPYFSRAEIDMDGKLKGRNLEIAWLPHPVDTYELMLQGSGLLAFDDGTTQAILFAGLNGSKGRSMLGYLMDTKQLPRREATMQGLRRWWDDATEDKRRAFLEAASGYAFFRYGSPKPQGTAGGSLTPWISMATDPRVLPLGGILAYSLPTKGKKHKAGVLRGNTNVLHGLGFAHDTGGAILMQRIDLYAGEGQEGHDKAMSIYTKGDVWLLLKK